jgi:hypothetical protein
MEIMADIATEIRSNPIIEKPNWIDISWSSSDFRRAHLNVVDMRAERKMLMLHFCIFPHVHNSAPIFGLDIIAGERKITGFFHDYSLTVDTNHSLHSDFKKLISKFQWKKQRDLPSWAQQIFSDCMLAAGNVTEHVELEQIINLSSESIKLYLDNVGKSNYYGSSVNIIEAQNKYCHWQKKNPQLHKSMMAFGFDQKTVDDFVNQSLFPEIDI